MSNGSKCCYREKDERIKELRGELDRLCKRIEELKAENERLESIKPRTSYHEPPCWTYEDKLRWQSKIDAEYRKADDYMRSDRDAYRNLSAAQAKRIEELQAENERLQAENNRGPTAAMVATRVEIANRQPSQDCTLNYIARNTDRGRLHRLKSNHCHVLDRGEQGECPFNA